MNRIIFFAAFLPFAALAAEDKELTTCAAIKGTVERLSCFDEIASKRGLVAETVATPSVGKGKWRTSTTTDPLTDKSVYVAGVHADQGVGRFGETIGMVVRCKDNQTDLYINWQSYLGLDSTPVTHRIDKNKAVTSTWDVSTDHKSAFMRSPVAALKQMVKGESFIANVTPYGENPVTAAFNIAGTEAALQDIRKGCRW
ncbi:type VI secretion system-associated protein TagO [Pseudomonas matsuisoli]|uniref:DNA primase n=1 Tax=Pseudomonas matsuisoli TaxID=1515666 RepID=A0A917UXA4_9PSED|nr:type VI secretion system-associated protein TagO [Pseudomonas matsuisoli]GGJ92612.1 hypothetical protein GCM10009304_18050 [Pseudomonas matsuisoli]